MHTTSLRKVGGSVMLAVPPAILEMLRLQAGSTVGLSVDGDCLVINAKPRPHYTVDELLDASDYSGPRTAEDEEWLSSPAVGRELI
jgi:antitoxin ChpS